MSTRATIHIKENGSRLVSLYHHTDGYPSWLGVEIAKFIQSGVLTNGIGEDKGLTQFNGAGCFAAAIIKHFKDGPGGLYVCQPDDSQEYDYTINMNSLTLKQASPRGVGEFEISCKGHESTGPLPPAKFLKWAEKKG